MATSTYYADAHSGVLINNGSWTNPSNLYDGNTATATSGGSELKIQGTTASSATTYAIATVQIRLHNGTSYGGYVTLVAPSGGWTWAIVSGMIFDVQNFPSGSYSCYPSAPDSTSLSSSAPSVSGAISQIELLVTYTIPGTAGSASTSGIARISKTSTKLQPSIARISRVKTSQQQAIANIQALTGYSRGAYSALPSSNAALSTAYTNSDLSAVSATDSTFVVQSTQQTYAVHQFSNHTTDTSAKINPTWTGKAGRPATIAPIVMQLFNITTGQWELLATNTTASAGQSITISGHQTTNLSNYYDGNGYCYVRVYQ